jgi:acyl-CoA reductase-like NAD-dependent aldehyde dehydrogenase
VDEAIALVNGGEYGNMACVFTSSGAAARKFRYEAEAGNIGINIGVAAPMAFFPVQRVEEQLLRHAARAGEACGRVLHPDQSRRRALARRVGTEVLGRSIARRRGGLALITHS